MIEWRSWLFLKIGSQNFPVGEAAVVSHHDTISTSTWPFFSIDSISSECRMLRKMLNYKLWIKCKLNWTYKLHYHQHEQLLTVVWIRNYETHLP